jgi:site-specific recombinase XerD
MITPATITPRTDVAQPSFTVAPVELITRERLVRFQEWLLAGGYSREYARPVLRVLHQALPPERLGLDLELLLQHARRLLEQRTTWPAHRKGQRAWFDRLEKLREFVLFQRGQPLRQAETWTAPRRLAQLPDWVREPVERYVHYRQRQWPPYTLKQQSQNLIGKLSQALEFFLAECQWTDWKQLSLRWVDTFVDASLRRGLGAGSINGSLQVLAGFCAYLGEEGYPVSPKMTQVQPLTTHRRLPRPLTDDQIRRLEQHFLEAIGLAPSASERQQAIMNVAWFYLMWHCGLRLGEVHRLTVKDLDLEGRKLLVRDSKERKDRVAYLSDTTVSALRRHLATRPDRESLDLFTRHHRRITTRTISRRLVRHAKAIQVAASPHRLRHTFASQMLNAGMPITSLQRYLGHEALDTTMNYAAVSDPVLQQDYYRGISTMDPSSARLAPMRWTSLQQAELKKWIAALRAADPAGEEPQTILGRIEQLLGELDAE